MVGSWLVKLVVGIAVVAFAALEFGSPLVAKAQLDSAAHEVADEVALRIQPTTTRAQLLAYCADEASLRSITVTKCELNETGKIVTVTATKEARSFILKNVGATEDWYVQTLTVTSTVE